MTSPDHVRRLERLYHAAPVTRWQGTRIEIREAGVTVSVEVRPEFHHAAGAVHGSILFRLLDDAAFFAANAAEEERLVLTQSFTVHYVRPVSAGTLVARGRVLHRSRRVILAEAAVRDGRERVVARGTGTFMPSEIRLEDLEAGP